MKKFDVIIIGSGMGGLTAGVYLSKKGFRVLIVEKHTHAGGYCSSFKRSFFRFDCGAHLIGSCNKTDSFGNILKLLDVKIDLIQLNPTDRFFFGEDSSGKEVVEVPGDYMEFATNLKKRFKTEKKNIENFFIEIAKVNNQFLIPTIIKKYESATYQALLDNFFQKEELKGILSAQCGFLGLPPKEVSAISAVFMLKMFLMDGAFYPRGGAQNLADAFTRRFTDNGGTLFLSNKVTGISLKNRRVTGVMLESKEFIEADYVISNIDGRSTFFELLKHDIAAVDREEINRIKKFKVGHSCFALFIGLNDRVNLVEKNGWYYPHHDINQCFKKLLYMHIPTNYDRSVIDKQGHQILIVYTPFVFDDVNVSDWARRKKELTEHYMRRLERIFPGLEKNIIVKETATPWTFERYTGNSMGALYGWKQIPQQVYLNSFPQKTSISGLFLAGHWTFPGGGVVTVALSGMNAGRSIIKMCETSREKKQFSKKRDN